MRLESLVLVAMHPLATGYLGLLVLTTASCRKPAARDSIVIAVPYEVETLDPHAEDKASNLALLSNLYEPRVVLDRNLKVTPGLAMSWESPDSSTWVTGRAVSGDEGRHVPRRERGH